VTGPKLNEANRVAGTRGGVKAQLRWVRMSASKFRPVLDQMRGLDVTSARELLSLHEVGAAAIIQKLLKSAVSNAVANNEMDEEKLYVKACFADESPTIKRFRPRARGRANTRLRRGAHVTIVVDEMDENTLKTLAAQGGTEKSDRRKRVAASQARAAAAAATDAKSEATSADAGEATESSAATNEESK
jgi:large subunit ribosomal protein L22